MARLYKASQWGQDWISTDSNGNLLNLSARVEVNQAINYLASALHRNVETSNISRKEKIIKIAEGEMAIISHLSKGWYDLY